MTGRTRAERKAAAVLRAQLSLKHAIERIDFDYDVVKPKLEEIRQLEVSNTVEIGPGDPLDGTEYDGQQPEEAGV